MNKNMDCFKLNSSHQSFKDKQKSLFDELDKVHKNLPEDNPMDVEQSEETNKDRRDETKYFKGQKSLFKRPEAPLSRCLPSRKVPDYIVNPDGWTKYSLRNVDEMTERSNKSAALSFLKELEKRKEPSVDDEPAKLNLKPQFNKSVMIDSGDDSEDKTKHTFKSSKVVMPEYVVGQKIKKEKKNREKRSGNVTRQLTLNHLLEDDDNEEET